jgi:hypothetical protein
MEVGLVSEGECRQLAVWIQKSEDLDRFARTQKNRGIEPRVFVLLKILNGSAAAPYARLR